MENNSKKSLFAPLSESRNVVIQELDDEMLVYNLKTHKAFCLNKTSAFVWQNADGKKSVNEISNDLSKIYKEKVDDELVWIALNDLAKEDLIVNLPEGSAPVINRREVIKRIGLGTAIALPIISGLVAPTAVHAASTCNTAGGRYLGGPCSTDADCAAPAGCGDVVGIKFCIGGTCCCEVTPI